MVISKLHDCQKLEPIKRECKCIETLSRVNYKETLRVFVTIVVYLVIAGLLVTPLWTCECVSFFLNCPV
jgi:hypothetical protein